MKNIFIAGNWKSNKTNAESQSWMQEFAQKVTRIGVPAYSTVVVVAPFTSLSVLKYFIGSTKIPVALGAQNVSKFDEGAYTGEVSARMVKELADWVIVGHSERRKYFGETDADLSQKAAKAKAAGLKVIFCVPDDKTPVPTGVDVVAYEPVWAIGTGKSDTPENADGVISRIKTVTGVQTVIYGGSVTPENVKGFVFAPSIDGVLPGGASLDPQKFTDLIAAAVT